MGGESCTETITNVSDLVCQMSQPLKFHVSVKNPHLKFLREAHFGRNPDAVNLGEFQVLVSDNKSTKLKISKDFSLGVIQIWFGGAA